MLHLIKLCVGAESVSDLADHQAARADAARADGRDPRPAHVTRQTPRREAELLDGGSLYWVIRGEILARQRFQDIQTVALEGRPACALILDPELILVAPTPRRPFQGWRYLPAADAPPDLALGGADALDPALLRAVAEYGVV